MRCYFHSLDRLIGTLTWGICGLGLLRKEAADNSERIFPVKAMLSHNFFRKDSIWNV
jgi:hypothetical protein